MNFIRERSVMALGRLALGRREEGQMSSGI